MEPPTGFWASLWNFIRFLPFFVGLLLLGNIKGVIFCPLICLIITIGNSAIIVGLWPAHSIWTYYCVIRAKQLGPILKLVICICVLPVLLISWPMVGIIGSIVGGAAFGFLSPIFATFDAVGEGKTNTFSSCIIDGTWSTIKGSLTVVRDVRDVCFHSYFSIMDELRQKGPPDVKYLEIRLLYLPGAVIAGVLGIMVDTPVISSVAFFKGPYMLFKGWNRLFHDLIGREGPFLETICVPFAGLAILLWPLAVVGAVLASMLASIFLGAFAGVVAYQESSFLLGLRFIVAALSIYDEYSNDILDMPEGSCFPRPQYRRKAESSGETSRAPSFSKHNSFKRVVSRTSSLKNNIGELKPLELLDGLFKECHHFGESMVSEGLITHQDIQEAKSGKGSGVIRTGLPAYCLLQTLLRSAKANSTGILLRDGTELTSTNRPSEKFFDWFLSPLLIIKDQIKAENLSAPEEDYLCKLVLLSGDTERLKNSSIGPAPDSELKRAELDGLARRLRGLTKSMSRFPTFKRRFDYLVKTLSDDLAEKQGAQSITRSKSAFARILSLDSFKGKRTNGSDQESEHHVPMAYSSSSSTALLVLLLTILWCSVCSFEFQVGGSEGWVVPLPNDTNIYNAWASHNRFQVGDSIRFRYKKDSVMEVSEEGYKNCNSSHPNMFSNNGNTVFRFDHAGSFYFISGASGHCHKGQKMIVRVLTQEDTPADHAKSSAFRLAISPLQLSNVLFHFVFALAASYVV